MIGMGTVVMNPVIGNLSDLYGRKALLTFPLTLSIIPLGTFACLISFCLMISLLLVGAVLLFYMFLDQCL